MARGEHSEHTITLRPEFAHIPELQGLRFVEKLTDTHKDQLVQYSTDPTDEAIQKFTSDPKRFKDREAVEKWLKKKRFMRILTNNTGDLLGICWLGSQAMPTEAREFTADFDPAKASEFDITYAIRTYGVARGKQLAGTLSDTAIEEYKSTEEYQGLQHKQKWLESSADNIAGVKLYLRLGFTQATTPNRENKILMVSEKPKKLVGEHTIYSATGK